MASQTTTGLWSHPDQASTQIDSFRRYVNRTFSRDFKTFDELHDWSVTDMDAFAHAVWVFCGVIHSRPYSAVGRGLEKMWPPVKWFPDALLNYTENILGPGLAMKPDAIAVTSMREGPAVIRELTFAELEREVMLWGGALRRLGVGKGDRIATVLTNSIEALVVLLAAAAIGAVVSSTSPEMGPKGIIERYSQINPKVLICDTKVTYAGKTINMAEKFTAVIKDLERLAPELTTTVIVHGPTCAGNNVMSLVDFLKGSVAINHYEQLPFDHPIYTLYSSGTTGPPKCICHAAGRVLLQHKKEHMFHSDLGVNSVLYQYTTTGWMMWNHLISALSCGTRIVLYDGNPLYPSPLNQLDIIKSQGVTNWGTSPKFLSILKQMQLPDLKIFSESLRTVQSGGAPLTSELYNWFYATFPTRVGLFSGSGGTDLAGVIVVGSPMSPVYPGEISTAALGMKVEIWDDDGKDISGSGGKGELMITKPFFSMPLTFWGDDGLHKYEKAYFDRFPGFWCHGDFAEKRPITGGYIIHGRSDGVLNPGGVRFGTAELYNVLDNITEIQDCIAVGQTIAESGDEQVILFVKLHEGEIDQAIRVSIQKAIAKALSQRHVPAYIIQVADIPYTTNGKKMENLIKNVINGRTIKSSGTAVNPECIQEYYEYEKLRHGQNISKL